MAEGMSRRELQDGDLVIKEGVAGIWRVMPKGKIHTGILRKIIGKGRTGRELGNIRLEKVEPPSFAPQRKSVSRRGVIPIDTLS